MQPGSTINPGGQDNPPQQPVAPVAEQPVTPVAPQPASSPVQPQPTTDQQPPAPTPVTTQKAPSDPPVSNWQFTASDQSEAANETSYDFPTMEPISWTASEYVDHEKNRSWFFAIAGATVLIAIIAFVLTRDVISSVVVIVAGGLLAVSAARKPHTLQFELNDHGLQIGTKLYPYDTFKSFTVLEEGALSSIQLLPARRFMPSLNIYYPPDQEEVIISSLGNILPHEERKRDAVDSLMRRIKF